MPGMIDFTCSRCRKRYGHAWQERPFLEQKPCPKCGHQPTLAERQANQAAWEETQTALDELMGEKNV